MGRRGRVVSTSAEETIRWGRELGRVLRPNAIVCFFGELGAGKTTLIKGIVEGATKKVGEQVVTSPTFSYLNIYEPVFHFDLYRLDGVDAFLSLGFEEYFFSGGICCLEWGERIEAILPPDRVKITLSHLGENDREIAYEIPKSQICYDSC